MKAEDIVKQLFSVLPKYTNLFSEEIPVTSITRSGSVVTVITSIAHGLSTGNIVNISNALAPILITNLTRELSVDSIERKGNIAYVKTVDKTYLPDNTELTISGANEVEYNITTRIKKINKSTFCYLVNGTPATPATGTIAAELTNLAVATTDTAHDQTMSERLDGQTLTVQITGANESEYNGIKKLVWVPNRKKLLIEVTGEPTYPATGTIYLLENRENNGYNGRFPITVIDPNTFSYLISASPLTPAQGIPTLRCKHRISRSERLERAIDSYTAQASNKYWLYVVLENPFVSKSRDTVTDATARIGVWTQYRQVRIEPFSIYIFAPTVDEIAAANVRDSMEVVAKNLIKSLVGAKVPSVFSIGSNEGIVYTGEVNSTINSAFYVHQFNFESCIDLTSCDIININDSVAFRDVHIDFASDLSSSDNIIIQSDIDLDDDPL